MGNICIKSWQAACAASWQAAWQAAWFIVGMSDFFLWHRSTIGHCKSQACIFGRSWRDGRGGRCHMLLAMTSSKMRPSTFAGVKDQLSRKIMLRACALNQWLANTMWSTSLTPLRRRHAALTASVMAHVCSWLAVSCAQCQLCNKKRHYQRGSADTNMLRAVWQSNGTRQHTSVFHGCSRRHCEFRVPTSVRRAKHDAKHRLDLLGQQFLARRLGPRVCARRVGGRPVKSMPPYLRVEANSSDVTRT